MTDRHRTNPDPPGGGPIRQFAVLAGAATATAGVVAGVGILVSSQLAGEPVQSEVLVGCGVSWIASCAGAIPVALAVAARSKQTAGAILGSTGIRFLIVLVLVVPLTLSGWFDLTALVLSAVVSYLCLLVVDTYLATRAMKRLDGSETR